MRVTIIGGTGFVGSHIARRLVDEGHEVVITGRGERETTDGNPSYAVVKAGEGVTMVKAIRDSDAVINCLGINRERGPQTFDAVHIRGTNNLLSAMRQTGVERLIHMSFLRARNFLDSPYHTTKWHAEESIRKSGFNYTILKPGVIYGDGDQFLSNLKTTLNNFPFFGLVGFRAKPISPIYIEDLTLSIARLLDGDYPAQKTYSVVGPEELTLAEIVDRTAESVDVIPSKIPLPVLFHRVAALVMEKTMESPLISAAQVTMLSESLSEGTPESEELPPELRPRTPFLKKMS